MNNLIYTIFLIGGLGLYFVFIRGSIIDLKTEYVPNNVVIGSYTFTIVSVLISSIILKSFNPVLNAFLGFLISFLIPFAFVNGTYYLRYFNLKRKLKKENIELQLEKEETLKENPIIDKKFYITIYLISIILLIIISIISKRHYLIGIGLATLCIELLLGKLLNKFYVIEYNHAEDQILRNNTEKDMKQEIEDSLEVGLGDGDIILFGSMGIMFSITGFLISFIYAIFAHIIIIILYSFIKKINPFKYRIPFIPALSIGVLIFVTGFDQYLFNFIGLINNIIS